MQGCRSYLAPLTLPRLQSNITDLQAVCLLCKGALRTRAPLTLPRLLSNISDLRAKAQISEIVAYLDISRYHVTDLRAVCPNFGNCRLPRRILAYHCTENIYCTLFPEFVCIPGQSEGGHETPTNSVIFSHGIPLSYSVDNIIVCTFGTSMCGKLRNYRTCRCCRQNSKLQNVVCSHWYVNSNAIEWFVNIFAMSCHCNV